MAQRFIEGVIGRLVTDEAFRAAFLEDPHGVLTHLLDGGVHLTRMEISALLATDSALWERVADSVDPRLQKASLNPQPGKGDGHDSD
jgi:hypothetical protein